MIGLTIISVGKLKERYLHEAVLEYSKRLSKLVKLNIVEIADEKLPYNPNTSDINSIKSKEGANILKKIDSSGIVIALDLRGMMKDSVEFAEFFRSNMVNGVSSFTFIIGGSVGLSDDVINFSNHIISFSKLTFPHQLMRVILLEQVYRCFKIINGEPYHR